MCICKQKLTDEEARNRCMHCAYLYEGESGEWVCDNYETDIVNVPLDTCDLEGVD